MTPETRAAIAFSRFGLGVTPTGYGGALSDPQAALKAELKAPPALSAELSPIQKDLAFSNALPGSPELLVQIRDYNQARRMMREKAADAEKPKEMSPNMMGDMAGGMSGDMTKPDPKRQMADDTQKLPQAVLQAEGKARIDAWMKAPIGFHERLVMFWANHFAVSVDKGIPVRVLAGAYEREAIRPHVTGKFRDLLLAAERHPAMQTYLDNDASVGPNSQANRNAKRGLNENLAREILELHTLGVNGGYSQADVTSFAKVITGWGVARTPRALSDGESFQFNARAHEPGAHVVLGKTYADDGERQGVRVLEDLARHPATAKHIATKLVRHFVADQPPPALVDRLAKRFTDTDGDLTAVYTVLIDAPESWDAPRSKFRSPQEYLIALLRATGSPLPPQRLYQTLRAMGQPLWQPPGPNGFSDMAAVWATPEGLSTRLDVTYQFADRYAAKTDPRDFAEARLSGLITDATRKSVAQAETRAQGLSIVLLSPEFMRR
ncbi:DUF1800 family protein [Asticcacaulis sp. YBE204]|uniref:DUF1800 domain-containing protein n=1 Tax=Asticcacaulis sp. YBE204 TaxID=1282363 RepID=UPI0003C400BF|nr:DUF1800 family protein [Asticcacaulis sp. YBE204]ESQ80159.1 hypothetical protein AEYBE204_05945 [Asticcacaulis sp. YBE204]